MSLVAEKTFEGENALEDLFIDCVYAKNRTSRAGKPNLRWPPKNCGLSLNVARSPFPSSSVFAHSCDMPQIRHHNAHTALARHCTYFAKRDILYHLLADQCPVFGSSQKRHAYFDRTVHNPSLTTVGQFFAVSRASIATTAICEWFADKSHVCNLRNRTRHNSLPNRFCAKTCLEH